MLQLIESLLQQRFRITFSSPAQHTDHQVDLSTLGVTSHTIYVNCDSFNQFITQAQPDVVIFDRFMMEEQFGWRVEKYCPNALRVLNTEDLHSLRQARHQAIKDNREFTIQDMHTDVGLREIAAILRCDLTLMISSYEHQLLKDAFKIPEYQLCHLPFMLQPVPERQRQNLPSFQARQHFIAIGNFRHAPNWDMVLQLKQHIWPMIRKELPEAELHIYGAYPPPKAFQLHNPKQGFMIKGWANNADEVMSQAKVCLAPIRFGAGIKGKLIQAMQNGTASVTTHIGAEAMCDGLPWNGVITDDFSEFATAAIQLYKDQESWKVYQEHGFTILAEKYNKSCWQNTFNAALLKAKNQQEHNRQKNFMGLMVRHHSLKSTQYMSQWITAKNSK
ncbi:glycosyltransferase [Marinomonas agarivorans]|nr:glycosyltransferase [Marinomonas agarivorans]